MYYKYFKSKDIIIKKNKSLRFKNITNKLKAYFINFIINYNYVIIILKIKLT